MLIFIWASIVTQNTAGSERIMGVSSELVRRASLPRNGQPCERGGPGWPERLEQANTWS